MDKNNFSTNRLISIDDVNVEDIYLLYQLTNDFKQLINRPAKKIPALKDLTIGNLFFEDSTRTRISFELAQKRLGADIVNFSASNSSLKKGESLNDTIQNLLSMKLDMIVIRHRVSGTAKYVFDKTKIPIINAGDGTNEHPTQALLDLFAIWNKGIKSSEINLLIKGDVLHSRVAGSLTKLLDKLNIQYSITGPKTIQRKTWESKYVDSSTMDLSQFNILYNLRIQKERQHKILIPSVEEYSDFFGTKINQVNENTLIMHPGPINRGIELDSDSADSNNSLILEQVETGVALRMAIMYLLGQQKREA